MKKPLVLSLLFVVVVVVALAAVFWPRTLRGEYLGEGEKVYAFSDGVVAIDTSQSPNEIYLFIADPETIESIGITEGGLEVEGSSVTNEGAEEFLGASKISVTFSGPENGKVRVIEVRGDATEGRQVEIEEGKILEFVEEADWDGSVRELLES